MAVTLISDDILIHSYFKAVDLELEKDFINLLLKEIKRRNLSPHKEN